MSRSRAREVAMMIIYSDMLGGADTPQDVCEKTELLGSLDDTDVQYAEEIQKGVRMHMDDLDQLIAENAVGWSIGRIGRVDLSILRVAVYEMLYREDVPTGAAINEAVELSKRYGGEKSFAFINGILGSIAKQLPQGSE